MKAILDTHAFIWWDSDPARLSPAALALILDVNNTIFVSVASIWEIVIKSQLGKLSLGTPLADIILQQQQNGLEILPITAEHALSVAALPQHHRDPFDRVLIAQAHSEQAVLVSKDATFGRYNIVTLW